MTREGGCLCGAIRFRTEGEPANVRICHCRNCQKAMGSPFFARALFDQRALSVEGDAARYPSSEALDREFCRTCGTRLFSRRTNGTMVGVALATFDDRNAFAPTEHIWVSERSPGCGSMTACRTIRRRCPRRSKAVVGNIPGHLPSTIERLAGSKMVAA